MIDCWLVVPVKELVDAKSRLAGVLTPARRAELVLHLLEQTLQVASSTNLFARILVVSRDAQVLALAATCAAEGVVERAHGLNRALTQASRIAQANRAAALLALPADLPLLSGADLRAIVALADQGAEVVLAASRTGGTNALYQRLPLVIPYAFGVGSFARHWRLAAAAGCTARIHVSPAIACDLDTPDDLKDLCLDFTH